MRRFVVVVSLLVVGCDEAHEHVDPELEAKGAAVTCAARLDRYPVAGPHNGGYDLNALTYTCPPHPASSRDGTDFLAGDHWGNDIFAARGTPLVAPRAGVVVRAGYSGISGLRVTIRDDCGWHYFLAHLDTITPGIVQNVRVEAGQVVGTVGNTGNAIGTSPHLHFSVYPEVYEQGIDPFPLLQAVDHTACAGCTARCEGSVIVDAGCGRGDCGAFGLTCSMASGSPACAEGGCVARCDGDVIVAADCGRGDCGAFGATCVMRNGAPTCEVACQARCDGDVIVGADCARGDCGAFGATCVIRDGAPTCEVACQARCDGDVIVGADCGRGDCGAFGATCVIRNGAPTCEVSCQARCDGDEIIGADCSRGNCAAFGLTCGLVDGAPGCVAAGCAPRCEGSVIVGADCGRGDCAAFGATCEVRNGAPTCVSGCVPHCEGNIIVGADCGRGDCGAFGATCELVTQGGVLTPQCQVGCRPHCEGNVIVDAECGRGDCGAFGLGCVVDELGAPECGTAACAHRCDGDTIIMSDCTVADCGAFGVTCGDFGVGPHCTVPACEPRCDGTVMVNSACERGDCGAFGLACSTAGGTPPRCVVEQCVGANGVPRAGNVCIGDGRYRCEADGGASALPCPAGQGCNACAGCGPVPVEVCNFADDDCDGAVDEGVRNACGGCGVAPVEVCNFVDDDCDGTVDEGVRNACGGCGVVAVEVCNFVDDDCDGSVDEGVRNACGACGVVAVEACNFVDDDCDGTVDEGVQNACGGCGDVAVEICNDVDDDCDGEVDEGFAGRGEVCSAGLGACVRSGTMRCAGDGAAVACAAVPGEGGPEACNGVDDDCDGEVDEGLNVGAACVAGSGACAGAGVVACAEGGGTQCMATERVCDDGDACTMDRCDAASGCAHEEVVDCCARSGASCVEGKACVEGQCEAVLCRPCAVGVGCPGDGVCVAYPGGSACATRCEVAGDCPAGFGCTAFSSDGQLETVQVCVAESETCECAAPAGPICVGSRWVRMEACGVVGEELETCVRGCVSGVGCCPAGTRAVDGACAGDEPTADPDPDDDPAAEVVEASRTSGCSAHGGPLPFLALLLLPLLMKRRAPSIPFSRKGLAPSGARGRRWVKGNRGPEAGGAGLG